MGVDLSWTFHDSLWSRESTRASTSDLLFLCLEPCPRVGHTLESGGRVSDPAKQRVAQQLRWFLSYVLHPELQTTGTSTAALIHHQVSRVLCSEPEYQQALATSHLEWTAGRLFPKWTLCQTWWSNVFQACQPSMLHQSCKPYSGKLKAPNSFTLSFIL